jgi:uncharacterized protein YndB with AHSA1/START domain
MKCLAAIAVLLSAPATAEVVSADSHGFEVRESVQTSVPPAAAWAAFLRIGQWWSPDHTYSHNSSNLALDPKPGGCFCERLGEEGGVEHMQVAAVLPPKRLVMTGSLGPLLYEAAPGVMDVKFDSSAGGTMVTLDYRASGFVHANADKLAPAVDQVLAEQLRRYAAFIK